MKSFQPNPRMTRAWRLGIAGLAATALVLPLAATAPVAAAPTTQAVDPSELAPVDPQIVVPMEDMTWDDYEPLPASYDWAHLEEGSKQVFTGALVAVRFKDRGFVVSEPIDDTKPLSNPNSKLPESIPEAQVPDFYNDLLNDPDGKTIGGKLNNGRTLNEYWLEQSGGQLSVAMSTFGPYTLPGDYAQYGLNDSFQTGTPRLLDSGGIPRQLIDGTTPGNTTNAQWCPKKYFEKNPDDTWKHPLPVWSTASRTLSYQNGCRGNIRADALRLWGADPKLREFVDEKYPGLPANAKVNPLALFDQVFYLTAGQDESSTWEEFGRMQWTQTTVPDQYGPPKDDIDPATGNAVALNGYGDVMVNWARTRYIPWTSWAASSAQWPNASFESTPSQTAIDSSEFPDTPKTLPNGDNTKYAGNSTQAESSGMGTFAHEFSHILGISDNYGNPFATDAPDGGAMRDTSGPWDMLSRGAFNGPGGVHARYPIPSVAGSSGPSGQNLRNRIKLAIVPEENVYNLRQAELNAVGMVAETITSRAVMREGDLTGINLVFSPADGSGKYYNHADRSSGACRAGSSTSATAYGYGYPNLNPVPEWAFNCDGGRFQNYTVEVVDRMGTDSFQPDHGVVLSKTKNADSNPFVWVIDANPQDIEWEDYKLPDAKGTSVPVTRGDQRQLSDSAFHAGTNSGSEYEYVDEDNELHFYFTNMHRDAEGILQYDVAIRSLAPALTAQRIKRGVTVSGPVTTGTVDQDIVKFEYTVTNTGSAVDIFRIDWQIPVPNQGWDAVLPEALQILGPGESKVIAVYAHKTDPAASQNVYGQFAVSSENNPTAATEVGQVNAPKVGQPTPVTTVTAAPAPAVTVTAVPAPAATVTAPAATVTAPAASVTAAPQAPQVPNTLSPAIVKVKAAQKSVTVAKGQSVKVPAYAYNAQGGKGKVTFKSASSKIAKVSKAGKIKGVKVGKTKVTVKAASGLKTTIKVVVVAAKSTAKVTSVNVSGVAKAQKVGQVSWATAKWAPASATGLKVKYSSTNSAVVSVDKAGRVVAKAPGTAKLKVKVGAKTKSLTIKVS